MYLSSYIPVIKEITVSGSVPDANVKIGSIVILNVTVTIPPYTQFKSGKIIIYSEKPAGTDSYYFVNTNVNFTGTFGTNIGINLNEPLPMTLKSSMNTSQMDSMVVDLGVVQNTGTLRLFCVLGYSTFVCEVCII